MGKAPENLLDLENEKHHRLEIPDFSRDLSLERVVACHVTVPAWIALYLADSCRS